MNIRMVSFIKRYMEIKSESLNWLMQLTIVLYDKQKH